MTVAGGRRRELAERFAQVRARLDTACRAAGRAPGSVRLLAVCKSATPADVCFLATLGQRAFGENRLDELVAKQAQLATAGPLEWHFLGRLQTNKAHRLAGRCQLVHSVDRATLLPRLARGTGPAGLDVLVQVSLDGDPARGGVAPAGVLALADAVANTSGLRLSGVMAIAPRAEEPRRAFARLRLVAESVVAAHPSASVISAGMSADLEDAVAEGATLVRVGGALFGSSRPLVR